MKRVDAITATLSVAFILFVLACSRESNKNAVSIIDLEASVGSGKIFNISNIVSEIRYIPLETSDSSLLGNVSKINYENGLIYIFDKKNRIIIFDSDGHFLRTFNRQGRGPEEYTSLYYYDILPGSGNINVHMSNRDIIQYESNGKYLGRFSIPQGDNFTVYPAIYLNDSTYAAVIDAYDKSLPEYSVLIFNPSDTIKYLMPVTPQDQKYLIDIQSSDKGKLPPSMKDMVFVGMGTNIYRYKDSARVRFSYNDTIFSLSPDLKRQSKYIIHFGKTRFLRQDISSISDNKEKQASLFRTPMESEDYLYLWFSLKDFAHEPYEKVYTLKNGSVKSIHQTDCYALFNKKTGYFTLLNQPDKSMPGIKEDILGGPPFWPGSISSKGELIAIYTVEELLKWAETHEVSPELAKIIKSLDDLDNPVVVIAK